MKGHPTNTGYELVELRLLFTILPLVLRNMFYRGAAIHHFVTSRAFCVMQCLPIFCRVNPTLNPFRSAEMGEAE
jgi:hypothetical protein